MRYQREEAACRVLWVMHYIAEWDSGARLKAISFNKRQQYSIWSLRAAILYSWFFANKWWLPLWEKLSGSRICCSNCCYCESQKPLYLSCTSLAIPSVLMSSHLTILLEFVSHSRMCYNDLKRFQANPTFGTCSPCEIKRWNGQRNYKKFLMRSLLFINETNSQSLNSITRTNHHHF